MPFLRIYQFAVNIRQKYKNRKNKQRSLQDLSFLFTPMDRKNSQGKASLHASLVRWRRAGMTVEASFILPLFFLAMITLVGFMDIYKLQTEKLAELSSLAKTAAMYSYGVGQEEKDIVLPSVYTYEAPFSPVRLPLLIMYNTVKVKAWTGSAPSQGEDGETQENEEMVYMTENGSVYHKEGCSYLNLSIETASGSQIEGLRNQYGGKYYPCEHCSDGQGPYGVVYITATGNRYHNSSSCSGLKRTVRLVKLSEVQGELSACSRCGGH